MLLYLLRHIAVGLLGSLMLGTGVLMLVLPGPGIAFIILSLTIFLQLFDAEREGLWVL